MKISEIKELVKNNNIKSYELEEFVFENMFNSDEEKFKEAIEIAENIRAEIIEEELAITLDKIKDSDKYKEKDFINTAKLKDETIIKGTELKIGTAKIPLSVAGPVKLRFSCNNEEKEFYIPIATNEAALVAGLNRGFKAINKAGGISTSVIYNGMTRAPLLEASDLFSAQRFANDINNGKYNKLFSSIVETSAEFTRFMDAKAFQVQNKIWLRLRFDTGEAMGMNSAVKYSSLILKELLDQKKHPELKDIKLLALSGNLCCDKKAAMINITEGRGYKAEAVIIISKEIIKEVFGTTPEKIIKLNFWKNQFGSSLAGSLTGLNANSSNTIAGIFAATGQDLAQVVESSTCFTFAAPAPPQYKGALKFSVTLPCLEIGTTGGGTGFGTSKEALNIIFEQFKPEEICAKNRKEISNKKSIEDLDRYINNKKASNPKTQLFAQLIAASVLAQELNLLAALTNEYELCSSHMRLARGET